jgi:hypothetical protein
MPFSIAPGQVAGVVAYEVAEDQAFAAVTYADIVDWTIPLPAGDVVTFDGILVFARKRIWRS